HACTAIEEEGEFAQEVGGLVRDVDEAEHTVVLPENAPQRSRALSRDRRGPLQTAQPDGGRFRMLARTPEQKDHTRVAREEMVVDLKPIQRGGCELVAPQFPPGPPVEVELG